LSSLTGCGVDAFDTDEARGLGAQLYVDIHDGGSSLEAAERWTTKLQSINSSARLVVWETNTRKHDFSRVVVEAQDLNDLVTSAVHYPLDSRVESFCMEKSGHDDGLWSKQHYLGDQGSVFFAPNSTWGQPPHYVHAMFAQHWSQKVLQVSATPSLSVSGVLSEDSLRAAVRVLAKEDVNVTFGLQSGGVSPRGVRVTVTQLAAPTLASDNPIWDPERYSPETVVVGANHSSKDVHFLTANSFSVFLFDLSS